jgi:hypothetical protein
MVDGLYRTYLAIRLGDDWDSIELQRLNDWVKQKLDRAWQDVLATAAKNGEE